MYTVLTPSAIEGEDKGGFLCVSALHFCYAGSVCVCLWNGRATRRGLRNIYERGLEGDC